MNFISGLKHTNLFCQVKSPPRDISQGEGEFKAKTTVIIALRKVIIKIILLSFTVSQNFPAKRTGPKMGHSI